jgi:hypothetical protein
MPNLSLKYSYGDFNLYFLYFYFFLRHLSATNLGSRLPGLVARMWDDMDMRIEPSLTLDIFILLNSC